MEGQSNFTFSGLSNTAPAPQTETAQEAPKETAEPQAAAPDNANEGTSLDSIMGTGSPAPQPEAKPAEGTQQKEAEAGEPEKKIPAWMSQLPEDMRSDGSLTSFEKISDLARAWKELSARKDGVTVPSADAKPEELEQFYQRLGKPKTAGDYKLEGEHLDAFRDFAFRSNLTQEQAAAVLRNMNEVRNTYIQAQQDSMKKQYNETERALRTEYGNSYSERMQTLAKGIEAWGGNALRQKLQAAGLSFDPDLIHMFIKLGDLAKEAGSTGKQTGGDTYVPNSSGGRFTFKGLK